jgi:hypothetical protein
MPITSGREQEPRHVPRRRIAVFTEGITASRELFTIVDVK